MNALDVMIVACYYSAPVGVRSFVINPSVCTSVCVCVCVGLSVRTHISRTAGPIGTEFCVPLSCGRSLVLLLFCCATLCISGFMNDVTFGRNGRDTKRGLHYSAPAINYVRNPGGV